MKIVDEFFGCDVFGPAAMQRYLPHAIYKQMIDVMEHGKELPKEIADTVANAMKDWAMDKVSPFIRSILTPRMACTLPAVV